MLQTSQNPQIFPEERVEGFTHFLILNNFLSWLKFSDQIKQRILGGESVLEDVVRFQI